MNALDIFFNPRSIAIIGASEDATRIGGRTLANTLAGGFAGPVYPINPGRTTVQGRTAFPSILAVPDAVDTVAIALPGEQVISALEHCATKGVRGAVVFSAGFNEAGIEGEARQRRLQEIVAASGMRVVGPNCLGTFNARTGAWLSFTALFQDRITGPAPAMVSQSGGSAAHVLRLAQARGLAIGQFVTTGNEADIGFGEAFAALAEDPDVPLILAYIEGVRDGAALLGGLESGRRAGKPVVALKVGRTQAGAAAAASHTASLAGEDRVYDAIFREYGVHRARSTEEMLDVAYAALTARRPVAGNRLGVVTISGGMGAQIADAASDAGLVLPSTPAPAQERLKALCPPGSPRNPVDITAQVSTDPHLLAASLRVLLETGECDMLLAFFGIYAGVPALSPILLDDLTRLRADYPDALIAVCIVCPPEVAARYAEAGLLVFEEPARAVVAMAALRHMADAFARPPAAASADAAPAIAVGRFNERDAKALLATIGIRAPAETIAANPASAAAAAAEMTAPFALKIVSADILHKSDVGGVRLDLATDAIEAAATAMLVNVACKAPDAAIEGLLVSEMAPNGVELIVGTRRDPLFGPIILAGLGGTAAEMFQDVAVHRAPVTPAQARAMLESLRSFALLDGFRGAPAADVDAAAFAIAAVSRLAAANPETIETIEINPLRVLAAGRGALALDAVIEPRSPSAPGDAR